MNKNDIAAAVPSGALAYKYADPTEGARYLFDLDEVREIYRVDPTLIVFLDMHAEAVIS